MTGLRETWAVVFKAPYLRLCTWVGNPGFFVCVQDGWDLPGRREGFHSYGNDFEQESFWKLIILENKVSNGYVFLLINKSGFSQTLRRELASPLLALVPGAPVFSCQPGSPCCGPVSLHPISSTHIGC